VSVLAVSAGTVVLSLIGLAVGLVVLIVVLGLFQNVLRPVNEIDRYADDILAAGVGIATNLDGVAELAHTRELVEAVPPLAVAYLQKVQGGS
jgi:hypothetical protein